MSSVLVKDGPVFLLTDAGGVVGGPSTGLFRCDTQFVSCYEWRLAGLPPVPLHCESGQPWRAVFRAANPALSLADGRQLPPLNLELVRCLSAWHGGVVEEVEVVSWAQGEVELPLAVAVGTCFRDIFEVRGTQRARRGADLSPRAAGAEGRLGYVGLDDVERRLRVLCDPAPEAWEQGWGEHRGALGPGSWLSGRWSLRLKRGERARIRVALLPEVGEARWEPPPGSVGGRPAGDWWRWLQGGPQVEIADPEAQRTLERGLLDLGALLEDHGHGALPVAGVPWFAVPFGRDSLLTAYQVVHLQPDVAAATLRTLAAFQGRVHDPEREEQPGKIVHELRFGEMARLGEVPFGRYYGTADATPLFLVLLAEHWRWTGDRASVEELLPAAEAALAWLDRCGDPDGDGLFEFAPAGERGLRVQSWKDSHDSMLGPDGSPSPPPLAVCEVQGYVYDAWRRLAGLFGHLGEGGRARTLRRRAEALRRRFAAAFWMPAHGYVALALDGRKRRVEAITSDPGHCLWSGILARDQGAAVARRLLAPDLWSGWGIRTRAEGEVPYNPLSYHNGSVWPHDNALIAAGLKRYGFDEAAARVAEGVFAAAARFPLQRLPELFGGQARAEGDPVPYPVACSPQAWAAGAPLLLVRAVLGLEADAARGVLVARPHLPPGWGTVRVRGLRVGEGTVDLEARGTRLRVLRAEGCRVVRGSP